MVVELRHATCCALYRVNGVHTHLWCMVHMRVHIHNPSGTSTSTLVTGPCTAAVGSSIGTAVGVSVSVTFVVFFSMGVSVASVLCYILRRPKESSYKPRSCIVPATPYDEVGTNKKMEGDTMEMNTNTAYGSHVLQNY